MPLYILDFLGSMHDQNLEVANYRLGIQQFSQRVE